ncbi:single-stranded DNA-binding protein [Phycisphaeraceae bacterium D3-23]
MAANYNRVILMGNLTRDPEMRMLPSNMPVASFGLAVNDRFKNKQTDQWEERPNFIDCEAFGRTAENIGKFFSKGKPIFIEGKLRFDQWEDKQSGQKRSKLKVVVDTFQFVGGRDGGGQQGGGGGYNQQSSQGNSGGWDNSPASAPAAAGGHEPVNEDDIPF